VSGRLVENDLSSCVNCDFKCPCVGAFHCLLVGLKFLKDFIFSWWDVVHVSRRDS
jgi:hypothetical protein